MTPEIPSSKARFGSIGFAAIALVCAGFAAFLMSMVLRAKGYKQEKRFPALVAAKTVPASQKLTAADVKVVMVEESLLPAGVETSLDSLFPVGKEAPVASTGLVAGDWILHSRLADPKNGTAFAGRVREGYRAIAVTVDKAIARSRLIYPGVAVDLVGTFRLPNFSFSRVLIQNSRVLSLEDQVEVGAAQASGGEHDERSNNDTVVTIEVSPAQAEIAALAAREGKVDLVLRGGTDAALAGTKGATTSDLMGTEVAALDDSSPPENGPPGAEKKDRTHERRSHVRRNAPSGDLDSLASGAGIEVVGNRKR